MVHEQCCRAPMLMLTLGAVLQVGIPRKLVYKYNVKGRKPLHKALVCEEP